MKTRQNTLRLMCVWPGISLDSNAVCLVHIVSLEVAANAENLQTDRENLKKYEKRINANAEQKKKKNDNWSECKSTRRYYKDKAQRKAHENNNSKMNGKKDENDFESEEKMKQQQQRRLWNVEYGEKRKTKQNKTKRQYENENENKIEVLLRTLAGKR